MSDLPPMDSTGKLIKVGDRVRFRGQLYSIRAFSEVEEGMDIRTIFFNEEQHTPEAATEFSVDLTINEPEPR